MRRIGLCCGLIGLAIATVGSSVAAETNQDPLNRLRFTSNVTAVFGSHPNLQVGDVLVFEIATAGNPGPSVVTDDMMNCDMADAGSCIAYQYQYPGTWHLEYRRSGEVVHSEDGTFGMIVALEGGSETFCFDDPDFGEFCDTNQNHDWLKIYEDELGSDLIIRFEAPRDWNPSNQSFAQMLSQANGDDIWSLNFFMKYAGTWMTYQYDYTTADRDARVSIPAGLKFDQNGGLFDSDRIGGDPSEVVVVPDSEPTRDGYKFLNWNTSTDGSGASYAPGESFTLGAEGQEETLFAQWAALPGQPTGLSVEIGSGEALLTWTAPSSNGDSPITGYRVQSSTNGTDWTTEISDTSAQGVMVRSIGGVATAATVTGLTNGTAYQFKVAAINSYGVGAYSTASSPATPNTTTTSVVDATTSVVDTTTTVATLPVTGSSDGSINPVLLALGFGGLLALFARRRVTGQ
ncbi:MAG: fibronectin type III domain-containing protein [Ilumatobacteraceae bacterium]|nr:fibronectin type III domain-containing protein [Ilumatobacteraceae bacterium]